MAKDIRDQLQWVVIELSYLGEMKSDEGVLEDTLRKDLGVKSEFPIFIPATTYYKNGNPVTLHLMQGYIFLSSGLPSTTYFALEKKPYINQVLSEDNHLGIRSLSVIPSTHVEALKAKLRAAVSEGISINTHVKVLEGPYEHMEGEVILLQDETASVLFSLRSRQLIVNLPKVLLEDLGPVKKKINSTDSSPDNHSKKNTKSLKIHKELPKKRPTASFFYDAVILALGEKTCFLPQKEIPFEEVQDRVLELCGIDVNKSPWPLKGRSGLYRRVHYAFRNQRPDYSGKNRKSFTTQETPGLWSLTEQGVIRAKEILKELQKDKE